MTQMEAPDSLLTKQSLALSLAPPRAPPIGSAHRALLQGQSNIHERNFVEEAHSQHPHEKLRQRIRERFFRRHRELRRPSAWHPHLPNGFEIGNGITRTLGVLLPLSWQNYCRDSGGFRSLADNLVKMSIPSLALGSPHLSQKFLQLTKICQKFQYGSHPLQYIDFISNGDEEKLLFFVHGGAWGSGAPWMYRLVATSFLEKGYAVAIIGYRTYPDGKTSDQVEDCRDALLFMSKNFSQVCRSITMMGHSSGAHISLFYLIKRAVQERRSSARSSPKVDYYIGLSGPYDIDHHFDFEAARGVEELSPMKAANGLTRKAFKENSPVAYLHSSMIDAKESVRSSLDYLLPPMLFVHGIDDSTVPFTATGEAARNLRGLGFTKLHEVYLKDTGHQDTIMHFMMGGRASAAVDRWLNDVNTDSTSNNVKSRL